MTGRRGAVLSIESTSVQDYVKAIYSATEWEDHPVTATHLATRLAVANSSVTGMVAKLVDLGLAEHRKYGPVSLTPEGRELALTMVRRHRLIETFLVTELGYGWDEVHDEAELLEHTVSDAFVERLDAKLGRPVRDPHGDPIPAADGSVRYPTARRLDSLDDGHRGVLVRVSDGDPDVLRLLDRHGVQLDDAVVVVRPHPLDPLGVQVGDREDTPLLVIGAAVAEALWIDAGTTHPGCSIDAPASRGQANGSRTPRLSR